jgi:hypothetical protein
MHQSKLHQLLGTLSIYELNRFDKFLRSPYFNEDERLITSFETWKPVFKAGAEPPAAPIIWNLIFGKKPFSNLKLARLYSDLAKKAEEFLVHDQLRNHSSNKYCRIAEIFNQRQLTRYFPEIYSVARLNHNRQTIFDAEFYLHQFNLEAAHNTYLELQNKRSNDKNIFETLEALDRFYFINKLNYLAALLHYKKFLSAEGEVALAKEILNHLEKNPPQVPAIAINYRIVLSLIEPDNDTHFTDLKLLLSEHALKFNKNNARNFYAFAINFCIRKLNSGKLNYVKELFTLYGDMLNSELITDESGALSQFDFKNMVTVALRANEGKWTEKFITSYKNRIPKADRSNAYTFNLARLYFYQKKFDKVLVLLQDVNYSDIFYQLDSKTTLMKTYYELGEYLPLMALKESFRILLRRKKLISEQNRINYMNFIRYTLKLYRADVKNVPAIKALETDISASTNVADKTWLLEKVNELMGF